MKVIEVAVPSKDEIQAAVLEDFEDSARGKIGGLVIDSVVLRLLFPEVYKAVADVVRGSFPWNSK